MWSVLLIGVSLLAVPSSASAQQGMDPSAPGPRQTTVTAGIGNAMGWIGAQAERYFANERLSAFGGVGYTPKIDFGDPTGLTLAAGLRAFTKGTKHRGFAELSVCQVATEPFVLIAGASSDFADAKRHYGPGIQAGYQYTAAGGFTVMVSVGVGYVPGVDNDVKESAVQPLSGLGFGYTWR